jgi:cell division septum initiation protein DivIVA
MMTTDLTPEFTTSLRGYDRIQVDDYVATLREWLDTATARLERAEIEAGRLRDQVGQLQRRAADVEAQADQEPPRSVAALGDRVARLLSLAEEAAVAVEASAEAAALELVNQARIDADEVTLAARTRQSEIEAWLEQANRQAAIVVGQAEERAAAAAATITSEAEARAASREGQAEWRAREMVEQAQTEAAGIAEAARVERVRVLQELAAQREELTRQINSLEAQRNEVLTALTDLRESLHRTLGQQPAGISPSSPARESTPSPSASDRNEAEASGPTVDLRSAPDDEPVSPTPTRSDEQAPSTRSRSDEPVVFDQAEHETADSAAATKRTGKPQ